MAAELQRRLAAIAALDAVGYSRQSEIDEAVALAEIGALAERVSASAAARGGRVFNTAGDGFMIEFASVTAAAACVEELLASARVPLRAGLHLDEVSATASGDLLGRGVNVASRLQQLAAPGELIVSGEVKKALRGDVAKRLSPRGTVKLAKMEASVETYVLVSGWGRTSPRFVRFGDWRVLAAAAAIVILAAGGFAGWRMFAAPEAEQTVAVLPFRALNDDVDAQFFADGVASAVTNALAGVGVPLVSQTQSFRYRDAAGELAARALGATYVVEGDVRREDGQVHIDVRVENAARGAMVFAKSFAGATNETQRLREQIAAEITGALTWGGRPGRAFVWRGSPSPEVAAAIFRIRQLIAEGDRVGGYETAREIARKAPNSARAQLMLAHMTSFSLRSIPLDERRAAVDAASAALRRAARLDPNLGDVYVGHSDLTPIYRWAERERLLKRAVELSPEGSIPPNALSGLYRTSGRLREAEPQVARAAALDPLWPNIVNEQVDVLMALGKHVEAQRVLARAIRLWPQDRGIIDTQFDVAIARGAFDDAQALLDDPAAAAVIQSADGPPVQEALVRALRTRAARDRAAFATACADVSRINRNGAYNCVLGLSDLGELDAAFRLGAQVYPDLRAASPAAIETRWLETAHLLYTTSVLFLPQTAALRADPRFVEIAERVGLLRFWRETKGPDFCVTEPAPVCARIGG